MSALRQLSELLGRVVFGQQDVIVELLTGFLARGHVLLEGPPGVAKTLTARTLAESLGLGFRRVQFTPDLMPSDILGTSVFRPGSGDFALVKGPIFTDVLVADELNRTPPRTQAALLEAMEERQVTLEGQTHPLPPHFFVVATQNPLELEGTYPLPEAQLDRFLIRVRVDYPDAAAELAMLEDTHRHRGRRASPEARLLDGQSLAALQEAAAALPCEASILAYVVNLVRHTREDPRVQLGASPRAAQGLLAAAKARAALEGQDFVTPDHVKAVAPSVLTHRLVLRGEAEIEGMRAEDVLRQALSSVQVPR